MEANLIIITVFVAIIEMIASGRWHGPYFRTGIIIYSKTYSNKGTAPSEINEIILNEAFKKGFPPSLIFKETAPGEFSFREKLFPFRLSINLSFMRGRLEINTLSRTIKVVGLLNWWIFVFILLLGYVSLPNVSSIIPMLFLFVGMYIIQKLKYNKVGAFAFEWNSRKWE